MEQLCRGASNRSVGNANTEETFDEVGERASNYQQISSAILQSRLDLPDSVHEDPEPWHGLGTDQDAVEQQAEGEQDVGEIRCRLCCRDTGDQKMCKCAAENDEHPYKGELSCST
jgi:hypothetical protein